MAAAWYCECMGGRIGGQLFVDEVVYLAVRYVQRGGQFW
jgi:hypothetical protein